MFGWVCEHTHDILQKPSENMFSSIQAWCDSREMQNDLLLLWPLLMLVDLGEGQYYNSGFSCRSRASCLFPICPFWKGPEMNVSTTVPPCVPIAVRVSDAWQWVKRKEQDICKNWANCFKLWFCSSCTKIYVLVYLAILTTQREVRMCSLYPFSHSSVY